MSWMDYKAMVQNKLGGTATAAVSYKIFALKVYPI